MGKQLKYRREIDGLRALAVISVIVNHFNENYLPSGNLGVDIFFVISGFVITGSLYNSNHKNITDFFLGFYSRRLKRLVPALILFTLITSLLFCLVNQKPNLSLKTGISALFGLSNLYLLHVSADYFAPSIKLNAFTHTWSLGVEEQFYFLFPLIIWCSGFNRQTKKRDAKFLWMVGLLSATSLCLFVYLSLTKELASFYLMPARFWEIGAGGLAFFLSTRIPASKVFYKIPVMPVLMALLGALLAPPEWSVIVTIAATSLTAILILSIRRDTTAYSILTNPVAVYVGTISYSLYLWHWGVLSIGRWTIGINLMTAPFLLVLMFATAGVSYRFIESPIRNIEWSKSKIKTVFWGFSSSVATAVLVLLIVNFNNGRIYLGTNTRPENIISSKVLLDYEDIVNHTKELLDVCNMTPHQLSGKNYRPQPQVDETFIDNCILNQEGSKKILLVGDSFARASAKHLSAIAHDIGYDFRMISGYGCPYPIPFSDIEGAKSQECKISNGDEILLQEKIIDSLNKSDLLVIRLYLPKKQYLIYESPKLPPIEAYDKGLLNLYKKVTKKGAKLLLIGANPTLTLEQEQFSTPQWFNFGLNSDYSLMTPDNNLETKYFHAIDYHLVELFSQLDNSKYFSLKSYICDSKNICSIKNQGMLLYYDSCHLTPYAHDLFFEDLLLNVKSLVFKEKK